MDEILKFLGSLAALGVVAGGVAVALFQVLGERLIGHRFDKALETFKDEQAREMEHLRYQISGLLDRTTRLNDLEFKVLPEAWSKLLTAYNGTLVHISSGRMGTSVNSMDDAALEELLKQSPMFDFQKDRVRNATDRGQVYNEVIYLHEKGRDTGISPPVLAIPAGQRHLPTR